MAVVIEQSLQLDNREYVGNGSDPGFMVGQWTRLLIASVQWSPFIVVMQIPSAVVCVNCPLPTCTHHC